MGDSATYIDFILYFVPELSIILRVIELAMLGFSEMVWLDLFRYLNLTELQSMTDGYFLQDCALRFHWLQTVPISLCCY